MTLLFLYKGIFQLDVKSIPLVVPEDRANDKTVDGMSPRMKLDFDQGLNETPQRRKVENIMADCDSSRPSQLINTISNPSHDSQPTHPVVPLTSSKSDHKNGNSASSSHPPPAQPLSLTLDRTMNPKLFNTQLHLPTSSRLGRPVCGPHVTFPIV